MTLSIRSVREFLKCLGRPPVACTAPPPEPSLRGRLRFLLIDEHIPFDAQLTIARANTNLAAAGVDFESVEERVVEPEGWWVSCEGSASRDGTLTFALDGRDTTISVTRSTSAADVMALLAQAWGVDVHRYGKRSFVAVRGARRVTVGGKAKGLRIRDEKLSRGTLRGQVRGVAMGALGLLEGVKAPGVIDVFVVLGEVNGKGGAAGVGSDFPTLATTIVIKSEKLPISSSAGTNLIGHEIAHLLLDSAEHSCSSSFLMHESAAPLSTAMTCVEIAAVRRSSLLNVAAGPLAAASISPPASAPESRRRWNRFVHRIAARASGDGCSLL